MYKCHWCQRQFDHPPVETVQLEFGDSAGVLETLTVYLCSPRCAWLDGIERHRVLYGMSGKEVRRHLIEEHGLTPPRG